MGSWPFTRLHFGCGRCVTISGPHIQVLDADSGQILHSTSCASAITYSAIDEKYVNLVTTGDDKKLDVWDLSRLKLKSSRELPKKATVVQLSHDGHTILVADKFGDVFSYPLTPPPDAVTTAPSRSLEPRPRDSLASHENLHGSLVLGHASIITSFLLSHDGRYIITADRDEHIRVSRYPHGYIIERYCLGHELFVSAICLPTFEQSSLVSGGGDPSLRIWDWISGTLKCQIPVVDAVRPFLKVRASRERWHQGDDGDGAARRGRKAGGRGKKGKQISEPVETLGPGQSSAQVMSASDAAPAETTSVGELVFALAKVEALDLNGDRVLVFSAIGGSALFYCSYPSQPSDVPSVRHIDFSRPVLDFVVGYGCQVLVSLDTAWIPPPDTADYMNKAAILVEWQDGCLKVADEASALLASLNGAGSQDASAAELASLDLYSALALLPKHPDGAEDGEGAAEQDSDMRPDTPEGSQGDGKKKFAKVAGRLKTKQALLRRQELDQESSPSGSGDERGTKKIKLDEDK